ncbi:MAG: amidohydrolase [Verrucomicrobiota bacterium]
MKPTPDLILTNGRITTLDRARPEAREVVVAGGRVIGIDNAHEFQAGPQTRTVDLGGRRAIPGLNDSHIHVIRGGLNYNLELRWEGVPSLALALAMLKDQVARTPAPQWVRVVGGWSEFQFAERRMPTLEEINAIAPDTPVFILHLYCRALLNRAALRACGYTKDTPNPPGGEIVRDKAGNPTGMLIARPNATILYATLAKGPKLPPEYQYNSTRHFMRELNRLGLTSVCDAGGGYQNYPEDYEIIRQLHERGEMTLRIAYNLFTQKPGGELDDFKRWSKVVKPGDGDDLFRCNGAGEMLVFSAADFEDFLEPRPDLDARLEGELEGVVRFLAENRWPFRLHATYNESIGRFLTVFERVNRDAPLDGLHWFFDHCETITDRNIERVKALGGGIAVQHRMAYQGEYFVDRYGARAAERTPPLRRMLEMGVPVGAGTDATRVASYNPFVSLYWMSTGRTLGGLELYSQQNRLSRGEALRLYTQGSTWMSREEGKRGAIAVGQLADIAVLTADYFAVPDEEIKSLESVLTLLGGKPVYAAGEFKHLDPGDLPVMPDWSPVQKYRGYWTPRVHRRPGRVGACLLRRARSRASRTSGARFLRAAGLAARSARPARWWLRVFRVLNRSHPCAPFASSRPVHSITSGSRTCRGRCPRRARSWCR